MLQDVGNSSSGAVSFARSLILISRRTAQDADGDDAGSLQLVVYIAQKLWYSAR